MSLKIKLAALVAISICLVTTAACKGKKAKEAAKQACSQIEARTCADGSKGVKEAADSCYQKCPEDEKWSTLTVTATETATSPVTAP